MSDISHLQVAYYGDGATQLCIRLALLDHYLYTLEIVNVKPWKVSI